MIPQHFGPMLGKYDCENMQDFYQYYKGRYFAIPSEYVDRPPGILYPTVIYQIQSHTEVVVAYFDGSDVLHIATPLDKLVRMGKFGVPMLGTIPWKHTYLYLSQAGYRESAKGISSKLTVWWPDQLSKTMIMYMAMSNLVPFNNGGATFGRLSEMEAVYNILNNYMYTWEEAMELLRNGRKLGCNISNKIGIFIKDGEPNLQVSYRDYVVGLIPSETLPRYPEIHIKREFRFMIDPIQEMVPSEVRVM
jgi:hypothetical protein